MEMIKFFRFKLCAFLVLILMISCGYSRKREDRADHIERTRTERRDSPRLISKKGRTIIKMRKEGGVYHVPCKINGTEMEFIFDTGASNITVSLTEAKFLYKQGKLKDEDFIGTQQYQIADGSIHEGLVIVLRNVEIGGKLLTNVEASIVDNEDAPLLLGQSALAKFGRISIDYNRNEIIFE
jgi:aspartyl protease family protein